MLNKHKDYDKRAVSQGYRIREWVLVRFLAEETGRMHKLAGPWHGGPYQVTEISKPDLTVEKVYQPQDGAIQVHMTRVTPCPDVFPQATNGMETVVSHLDVHPDGSTGYFRVTMDSKSRIHDQWWRS